VQVRAEDTGNALSLLARFGTLGVGAEASAALSDRWGLRLGVNGYSTDEHIDETDVSYDAEIDLRNAGLTVDWHPARGAFRVSLGAYYNGTEFGLTGRTKSGTFEINNRTYTSAQIAGFTGRITFNKFAPFLGVGFSNNAKKGFAYSIDLGYLYQRSPKIELNVTCGTGVSCTQLQADGAAETVQLREDLKDYKYWPVLHVGFGYAF